MIATSTSMALRRPAPVWFEGLLAPRLAPVILRVGPETLTLVATDTNEVAEVWKAFRDDAEVVVV